MRCYGLILLSKKEIKKIKNQRQDDKRPREEEMNRLTQRVKKMMGKEGLAAKYIQEPESKKTTKDCRKFSCLSQIKDDFFLFIQTCNIYVNHHLQQIHLS